MMEAPSSEAAARTTIAAHRGGAALNPENSRAAFLRAIDLRVAQIETDVHLSADDEPVLIHDPTLDRTTQSSGAVRDLCFAQLQQVKLKGVEETVPHLDELLSLLGDTSTDLRLEIKLDPQRQRYPGMSARLHKHLRAAGMLKRTTITSFDWLSLRAFQQLQSDQRMLGLIKRPHFEQLGGLIAVCREARTFGLDEIAIHYEQYETGMVQIASQHGIRLGLYAVNDASAIEHALRDGVCAFTSDRPDIAVQVQRQILH